MKIIPFPLVYSFAICSLVGLNSCVSTVTMEPEEENRNGDKIVLNFHTPEEVGTRADDTHKLRYIAMLYKGGGSNQSLGDNPEYRYELIEGDTFEGGEKPNQVVFEATTGQEYTIFLIADHIPAESSPKNNGLYGDYYYNTNVSQVGNGMLRMLHTPGKIDDTNALSTDFFNNDNYDCFAYKQSFTKEAKRLDLDITLQRIVSKVRVVDNSQGAGNYKLEFSSLNHPLSYDLISPKAWQEETKSRNLTLAESKNLPGDTDEELFYFYTFAYPADKTTVAKTSFTFSFGDNTVEAKDIEVKANYITTVKGNFNPDTQEQEDKMDDLVFVNMSTNPDWQYTEWNNE